jgi:hypothetical protein
MKGMNKKNGGLNLPRIYKNGIIAIVPNVPGANGIKPTPKNERKSISSLLSDGRLSFSITQ